MNFAWEFFKRSCSQIKLNSFWMEMLLFTTYVGPWSCGMSALCNDVQRAMEGACGLSVRCITPDATCWHSSWMDSVGEVLLISPEWDADSLNLGSLEKTAAGVLFLSAPVSSSWIMLVNFLQWWVNFVCLDYVQLAHSCYPHLYTWLDLACEYFKSLHICSYKR